MKKVAQLKRIQNSFAAMSVGQRLAWLLVLRGLTQSEAARQASISQSAIANLIGSASRQPCAKTLLSLASTLNTTPHFLLFGEGDPLCSGTTHEPEEHQLLSIFRKLDPQKRSHVLTFAQLMQSKSDGGRPRNL